MVPIFVMDRKKFLVALIELPRALGADQTMDPKRSDTVISIRAAIHHLFLIFRTPLFKDPKRSVFFRKIPCFIADKASSV